MVQDNPKSIRTVTTIIKDSTVYDSLHMYNPTRANLYRHNSCTEQGENGTGMPVTAECLQRVIICSKVDCKYIRITESIEKCATHLKTRREII